MEALVVAESMRTRSQRGDSGGANLLQELHLSVFQMPPAFQLATSKMHLDIGLHEGNRLYI